jgi:hypothetical protein
MNCAKIPIVVVARSEEAATAFKLRHLHLANELFFRVGVRSYFQILIDSINDTTNDLICVVHDDVFLPMDFLRRTNTLADLLESRAIRWGVCGNSGITPFGVGLGGNNIIRFVADLHGGANFQNYILPATSVDGNVLLLNTKQLREAGVNLPDFGGFQLYDIAVCLETISKGISVWVAPHLSCYHASEGSQNAVDAAVNSTDCLRFLSTKFANNYVTTVDGTITIAQEAIRYSRLPDLEVSSLRAAQYKNNISIAIVVRTQFKRPELLTRAIMSVNAFIASAGTSCVWHCYIVSDQQGVDTSEFDRLAKTIAFDLEPETDTRNILIRSTAHALEEHYIWFVDDDDWLFPNHAERLSLTISTAPDRSMFFVDTSYFCEPCPEAGQPAFPPTQRGRHFRASEFSSGLNGINVIPNCGMILPAAALRAVPSHCYEYIVYYEDFLHQLYALLYAEVVPIIFRGLVAGISIRPKGNSVTEEDRSKWNASLAELVSFLAMSPRTSQLLGFRLGPNPAEPKPAAVETDRTRAPKRKKSLYESIAAEWRRFKRRRLGLKAE